MSTFPNDAFPNDAVTASALDILAEAARDTVRELELARDAMAKVADRAAAAGAHGLQAGDLEAIKSEMLKAGYARELARARQASAADQVIRLIRAVE
jgi:hypothetical protein